MNKKLKLLCLLSTLCLTFSAAACNELFKDESTGSESISSETSVESSVDSSVDSSSEEETDVAPTSITLEASSSTIAKGSSVTFTITCNPATATLTDYDLSIDGEADFAEINNETKTLTIKSDALPEDINNKVIVVKATLKANPAVTAYKVITVSEEASVTYLSCDTINFIANKDSNKTIITEAYSWDGSPMEIDSSDLTYEVDDETVITVAEDGKITPKSHGTATVEVSYGNVKTDCVVNVMVAPEAIEFNKLNAHVSNVGVLHYAIEQDKVLDLGVTSDTKEGYTASTAKVKYKFQSLEANAPETVATYDADKGGILFHTTGKVRITVVSDSSIDGVDVNETYEVSKSITVDVNNGVNIYTVADLKAYANIANAGKTANFMADILLTDTDNFGTAENPYVTCLMKGSRTLQGNGYTLSTAQLSTMGQLTGQYNPTFLLFKNAGTTTAHSFSVGIYDLKMQGNTSVDVLVDDDVTRTYNRAVEIEGPTLAEYDSGSRALLENVVIKNVSINGFVLGVRVEHAISSTIDTFSVDNCYSNGLENCQSNMTLKDITIGQVGAFGIEITPDDMRNKDTASPTGSAGMQYNATATVKFEGYMKSNNWNNGASTPYMENLGFPIVDIVNSISMGLLDELSQNDAATKQALLEVMQNTMMNSEGAVNFSTLIFINPQDYFNYVLAGLEGNTQDRFCQFRTEEMISMRDLLTGARDNSNYDYTTKKYLVLDIVIDASIINAAYAGTNINIGQLLLINKAYQGD